MRIFYAHPLAKRKGTRAYSPLFSFSSMWMGCPYVFFIKSRMPVMFLWHCAARAHHFARSMVRSSSLIHGCFGSIHASSPSNRIANEGELISCSLIIASLFLIAIPYDSRLYGRIEGGGGWTDYEGEGGQMGEFPVYMPSK